MDINYDNYSYSYLIRRFENIQGEMPIILFTISSDNFLLNLNVVNQIIEEVENVVKKLLLVACNKEDKFFLELPPQVNPKIKFHISFGILFKNEKEETKVLKHLKAIKLL